jgi:catechol 2,3-dioxygenase-like lactoylglutathione lyase family enzyme
MLAHISIGVSDLARAKRFYDAALEPLGYRCLGAGRTIVGWGYGRDTVAFWIMLVARPPALDVGSGLHLCFAAPHRAAVDAFHAAALRTGGQDNGSPGLRTRYSPDYYAAFVIDPDGYPIEALHGNDDI